MSAASTPQ